MIRGTLLSVLTTNGWEAMRWERLHAIHPDGGGGGWSMHVVDASRLSTDEVAEAVLSWCRDALAGRAPMMRARATAG